MPSNVFDEFQEIATGRGVEPALAFLEQHFREQQQFFQLFEVLKMKCRHQLGLSLFYPRDPDDLDEQQQRILEDGLLAACREVGNLFFESGQLHEGWTYIQPLGDKVLSDRLIRSINVDDENIDSIIDIALTQGGAPAYGFELVLKHHGTCNGITIFDSHAAHFERSVQQQMAGQLLQHLYAELTSNIGHALKIPDADIQALPSLGSLLKENPNLLADGYHIDVTHLASTMRIVRILDDPSQLQMALEMADYGSRLPKDLQYQSDPPFEETYLAHQHFFRALLGQSVDQAIAYFTAKATRPDSEFQDPVAIETLVDLLYRIGRCGDAIKILTEQLIGKHEPIGLAPNALQIASDAQTWKQLSDFYRSSGDLVGFATSFLSRQPDRSSGS